MRYLMILLVAACVSDPDSDPSDPLNWEGMYSLAWTTDETCSDGSDLTAMLPSTMAIDETAGALDCGFPTLGISCKATTDGLVVDEIWWVAWWDPSGRFIELSFQLEPAALTADGFTAAAVVWRSDPSCMLAYRLAAN